jgi:hypothetical protein
VWRHVLHMGLSTGYRLPLARAVAAAAVRCFRSTVGSFCMIGIFAVALRVFMEHTQYKRPGKRGRTPSTRGQGRGDRERRSSWNGEAMGAVGSAYGKAHGLGGNPRSL